MHVRGFPNCYIMGPQQTGFTVNYPHMLTEQSTHLAHVIKHGIDQKARTVEVSEEAEEQWAQTTLSPARLRRKFLDDGTPGYYNN